MWPCHKLVEGLLASSGHWPGMQLRSPLPMTKDYLAKKSIVQGLRKPGLVILASKGESQPPTGLSLHCQAKCANPFSTLLHPLFLPILPKALRIRVGRNLGKTPEIQFGGGQWKGGRNVW